jgi:hypothetical protein
MACVALHSVTGVTGCKQQTAVLFVTVRPYPAVTLKASNLRGRFLENPISHLGNVQGVDLLRPW